MSDIAIGKQDSTESEVQKLTWSAGSRLILENVSLRDRASARVFVKDLELQRVPGTVVVLGTPADGTQVLCDALAGQRKPQRGRVSITGREPHRDAWLRARMGVLGHTPDLAPAKTVLDSVKVALAARSDDPSRASALLDEPGLALLASRKLSSLSYSESRAIDAALALSVRDTELLLLFEPFSEVASLSPRFVIERSREIARRCVVVVVTSSPADARRFVSSSSDAILHLHRGTLSRAFAGHARLIDTRRAELSAWVRGPVRELVKRLSDDRAVSSLSFSAEPSDEELESAIVRIAGDDENALSLALTDAATATEARVVGINVVEPTLAEMRAQVRGVSL